MRRFLLILFDAAARATAFILRYGLGCRARFFWGLFKDKVFTYANARSFKSFGDGAIISRSCVLVNPRYISIGRGASVGAGAVITAWDRYQGETFLPIITIGAFTSIGSECHITAINRVTIGEGVLLGKKISIIDNAHGKGMPDELNTPPVKRLLSSKGPVVIEDNVWIGDKVTVLAGVTIGCGSVIGANSVVSRDIPGGCIAAGVPARVIRRIGARTTITAASPRQIMQGATNE